VVFRAVVFDLWMTLVTPPEHAFETFRRAWSERLGVGTERLDEVWLDAEGYRRRETGPIRAAIADVGERLNVEIDVEAALALRFEFMREVLVPDAGVVATLTELREQGVATALVSNSTEDVALVWNETSFAGLFDTTVFSATAGFMKPDPEIYELALAELAVPAAAALFVGDGANDELEGARRVGMTPVLVHRSGNAPLRDGLEDWEGARISSIPQVLDLVALAG
jgi:putative hydrolase of the HAD superfamily